MSKEGEKKRLKNLIPLNKKSPDEVKKITSKGGKASGRSRRIASTFRQAAEAILEQTKQKKDASGNMVQVNGREALMGVLMNEAAKGNIKAIELIMNIVGEGVSNKVEVTGKDGQDIFKELTNKELDAKLKELKRKLDMK